MGKCRSRQRDGGSGRKRKGRGGLSVFVGHRRHVVFRRGESLEVAERTVGDVVGSIIPGTEEFITLLEFIPIPLIVGASRTKNRWIRKFETGQIEDNMVTAGAYFLTTAQS